MPCHVKVKVNKYLLEVRQIDQFATVVLVIRSKLSLTVN